MAKKQIDAIKNANSASIKRSQAYAEQVRKMFAETVNEILELQKSVPELEEGQMFSFDAQPIRIQKEVEVLLRRLSATATLAIQNGIEVEWDKANDSADELLSSVMGKAVLRNPHFSAWTNRNQTAMQNFITRKEGIMTLSDRIWKTARQLREEMEVALTVGIGEGKSSAQISREVRQYLNDPDLMFRRFRYKAGEEITDILDDEGNKIGEHKKIIWGKKWKKLVKDEDGKKHWIDYDKDDYKVGAGMYKSSAKNAMRVARTETNMAYKRADQERYKKFDFILGYHIEPSHNHEPEDCEPDICEQLKGDYPKWFTWEGWHPQCKCQCTPIMLDEDEALKMFNARANGKQYTPKGMITEMPQQFKDWCVDNEEKIVKSHQRGKDPYFVRHNFDVVKQAMQGNKIEISKSSTETTTENINIEFNYREDNPNLSLHERVNIRKETILSTFGEDSKESKYVEWTTAHMQTEIGMFDKMKLYFDNDTKPLYEAYNHLKVLKNADLSVVPKQWKEELEKNIATINAYDKKKGMIGIYNNIEGAYNIYKLSTEKACVEYGLEKLSTKTPYNILTEIAPVVPKMIDRMPKKEFFDSFDKFIPLVTKGTAKSGAYYSTQYKYVHISMNDKGIVDRMSEKWFASSVFYHEYGHAYDDLIGLSAKDEIKKVFKRFAGTYNVNKGIGIKTKIAQYISDKGVLSIEDREKIGTLTDTIQAMMNGHARIPPMGHSPYYFKKESNQLAEFVAHCSEIYWGGNDIFKDIEPDLYEEMVKLLTDIYTN